MNADSVNARLKNFAVATGRTFQEALVYYGLERTIYEKLRNAVTETFENRGTPMTMDSAAFGEEFLNDPMHQTRWKSFLKKKKY